MRVDRGLVKRWLHSEEQRLSALERERLREVLKSSSVFDTINSMRQELTALWELQLAKILILQDTRAIE